MQLMTSPATSGCTADLHDNARDIRSRPSSRHREPTTGATRSRRAGTRGDRTRGFQTPVLSRLFTQSATPRRTVKRPQDPSGASHVPPRKVLGPASQRHRPPRVMSRSSRYGHPSCLPTRPLPSDGVMEYATAGLPLPGVGSCIPRCKLCTVHGATSELRRAALHMLVCKTCRLKPAKSYI